MCCTCSWAPGTLRNSDLNGLAICLCIVSCLSKSEIMKNSNTFGHILVIFFNEELKDLFFKTFSDYKKMHVHFGKL